MLNIPVHTCHSKLKFKDNFTLLPVLNKRAMHGPQGMHGPPSQRSERTGSPVYFFRSYSSRTAFALIPVILFRDPLFNIGIIT